MNTKIWAAVIVLAIAIGGLFYFSQPQPQPQSENVAPLQAEKAEPSVALAITLYKSPTCGCCGAYEQYLRENGFEVETIISEQMGEIKHDFGVPHDMQSCHTAEVAGYFVEGHVPVEAIRALLEEAPEIGGIALPGMPMGSPGMGGEKSEPFKIYAISDGVSELYMSL